MFAQYGHIKLVKIINDRAGISKGYVTHFMASMMTSHRFFFVRTHTFSFINSYGFVTFERADDAQKVIKEAENMIIKNRKLNVSAAVIKKQDFPLGM